MIMATEEQSTSCGAGTRTGGIEERLKSHSAHFASMVELIPAKFYITQGDSEAVGGKYWVNKNKKKAPKLSVKEVTKKAKRLKLDPENRKSVAELQAEANQQLEGARAEAYKDLEEGGRLEDTATNGANKTFINGFSVERVQSTSLNNLQERLKEKIENFRKKRKVPELGAEGGTNSEEVARKRQKKMEKRHQKRGGGRQAVNNGDRKVGVAKKPSVRDEETGRIVFSKFDFTTPVQAEVQGNKTSAKKKDYKKLLAKAEAAQKRLDELKKNDEKHGLDLEKKLKWQKALDMARGTKLKDDPRLLKKTSKRLEKRKHKSSKMWDERKDSEQQAMKKRQEKRKKNIQERVGQIKAKKMNKRAKKGGPRKPGF